MNSRHKLTVRTVEGRVQSTTLTAFFDSKMQFSFYSIFSLLYQFPNYSTFSVLVASVKVKRLEVVLDVECFIDL